MGSSRTFPESERKIKNWLYNTYQEQPEPRMPLVLATREVSAGTGVYVSTAGTVMQNLVKSDFGVRQINIGTYEYEPHEQAAFSPNGKRTLDTRLTAKVIQFARKHVGEVVDSTQIATEQGVKKNSVASCVERIIVSNPEVGYRRIRGGVWQVVETPWNAPRGVPQASSVPVIRDHILPAPPVAYSAPPALVPEPPAPVAPEPVKSVSNSLPQLWELEHILGDSVILKAEDGTFWVARRMS